MPFFSKVFRTKDRDGTFTKSKKNAHANGVAPLPPPKPHWEDAWLRKEVEPEEVQELLRGCVHEVKSRGMMIPGSIPDMLMVMVMGTGTGTGRGRGRGWGIGNRESRRSC